MRRAQDPGSPVCGSPRERLGVQGQHLEGRETPVQDAGHAAGSPGRQVASSLSPSICRGRQLALKLKLRPGGRRKFERTPLWGGRSAGATAPWRAAGWLRAGRKPRERALPGPGQRLPRSVARGAWSLRLPGLRVPNPRTEGALAFCGRSEFCPSNCPSNGRGQQEPHRLGERSARQAVCAPAHALCLSVSGGCSPPSACRFRAWILRPNT